MTFSWAVGGCGGGCGIDEGDGHVYDEGLW